MGLVYVKNKFMSRTKFESAQKGCHRTSFRGEKVGAFNEEIENIAQSMLAD